jgi:hypothetical protein
MTPATLEVNVDAKGKFTVAMLITELLDAELLISPPELDGGQFKARSLLLKGLHNDIFIHVKTQDEFQLYEIVYVHQKCYVSLQSLVSMNQLCTGY